MKVPTYTILLREQQVFGNYVALKENQNGDLVKNTNTARHQNESFDVKCSTNVTASQKP